jgi:hypothetical protein
MIKIVLMPHIVLPFLDRQLLNKHVEDQVGSH